MAFTYDINTSRGKVRIRIGDTVNQGSQQSLDDSEIDYALTISSDVEVAAVHACEFLLAKLRNAVSQSIKGISSSIRERTENTANLLKMLKERAGVGEINVYFEGLSKSENDVHDAESDFVKPLFSLGMDDNTLGDTGSETDD